MSEIELDSTRALLAEVFGGRRYVPGYLEWQYEQNPDGKVVATNQDSDSCCHAHYAVIPQRWASGMQESKFGLSLNTAVSAKARGGGLFTRLAERTYADAVASGISAVVGVANANSTHGFVRRLGFLLLAPLPVVIAVVWPFESQLETVVATPEWLDGMHFKELANSIAPIEGGWSPLWTAERLRWRLASPLGPYCVHVAPEVFAITCRTIYAGLPFAVVLKILPRNGAHKVNTRGILRAAANAHRTPLVVYAGWNRSANIWGIHIPRKILPTPLNLIYRSLARDSPNLGKELPVAFEFLDFDAY